MNGRDSRSAVDRVVGTAIGLLVASVAVYAAVRLIQAIWSTLLIILGAALLLTVLVAAWRQRHRGW